MSVNKTEGGLQLLDNDALNWLDTTVLAKWNELCCGLYKQSQLLPLTVICGITIVVTSYYCLKETLSSSSLSVVSRGTYIASNTVHITCSWALFFCFCPGHLHHCHLLLHCFLPHVHQSFAVSVESTLKSALWYSYYTVSMYDWSHSISGA